MAKLTEEEKRYRDELSDYVRKEIFGYEQRGFATPNLFWVRVNGFLTGRTYGNLELSAENKYYTYKDILATFKYCKPEIMRLYNRMSFKNEAHRINTTMKIIDENIVTVKQMMEKSEQQSKKMESIKSELLEQYQVAEDTKDTYKAKSTQVDESLEEFFE